MKDKILVAVVVLAIVGAAGWAINGFVDGVANQPHVEPLYWNGNIVKFKNFDQTGMVVAYWCPTQKRGGTCTYFVRLKDLRLVEGVKEFEIERAR